MFWNNNKQLTAERDYLREARDEALSRLDSKARECERLVASTKTAIDASAKDRQTVDELQVKLDASTASLEKYDRQLVRFIGIVHDVRTVVADFTPMPLGTVKNNATLKTKLVQAQSLIEQVQEKTKVERQ